MTIALYYFGNTKGDVVFNAPHGSYTFNNPRVENPTGVPAPEEDKSVVNVHRHDVGFLKERHNLSRERAHNPKATTTFCTFKTEDELTPAERAMFGLDAQATLSAVTVVPAESAPAPRRRKSAKKDAPKETPDG